MNFDTFKSILKEYNIRISESYGSLTGEYIFFTMNDKILKHGQLRNYLAETDEDTIRELLDEMVKKYKNAIKQLRKQKIEEL